MGQIYKIRDILFVGLSFLNFGMFNQSFEYGFSIDLYKLRMSSVLL